MLSSLAGVWEKIKLPSVRWNAPDDKGRFGERIGMNSSLQAVAKFMAEEWIGTLLVTGVVLIAEFFLSKILSVNNEAKVWAGLYAIIISKIFLIDWYNQVLLNPVNRWPRLILHFGSLILLSLLQFGTCALCKPCIEEQSRQPDATIYAKISGYLAALVGFNQYVFGIYGMVTVFRVTILILLAGHADWFLTSKRSSIPKRLKQRKREDYNRNYNN